LIGVNFFENTRRKFTVVPGINTWR